MTNKNLRAYLCGGGAALLFILISFYMFCPAINFMNVGLWILLTAAAFVFVVVSYILLIDFKATVITNTGLKRISYSFLKNKIYLIPLVMAALIIVISLLGSPMFNATKYSQILTITQSDFQSDMPESMGTDSIALMDTASAEMLGDREIGSLTDVVSQFNVSDYYTQIDYKSKPIKVSPLEYAGFFKWLNNKSNGIGGYVTVDPVSMSASFCESEGMKYVPSAYFFQNAERYLWTKYPTLILENLHFEIDENGKPFYVASTIEYKVMLFGGKTVNGCVVLDPVTGETQRYALADVPNWIDVVFDGDLICEQYNWHGMYQNGYFNSLFAKKGCKQVTTYYSGDEYEETPSIDYGYVAKDGDIWIYTGITSVNGDSSNIGFLLSNERTGESRFYEIAGADEKSAMAAAEGEVQEKNYRASFPSLINVNSNPTYIMVLKDSGGLVKLYAAVNVEQYNIVTTASTQAECIEKYKALLGIDTEDTTPDETTEATVTVASVRFIDYGGDTYIYLFDAEGNIYKAKAFEHEDMLLIEVGDAVKLKLDKSGKNIIDFFGKE